ncbi:DegT/DnrJ/EryC1/StrS family aminotransferase [bacterium]|nr:DegT/DnrJ/EryC1/StrS family aminotransferase [bacterium]
MMKNPNETRIVGGMFGMHLFPDNGATEPAFLNQNSLCLNNARSGIWLLTKLLNPKQVWCPSYLCHTIVHAVMETKTPIKFYEMDYDLKIASHQWIREVQPRDLVIFINYFGFISDLNFAKEVKDKQAWVLADCSQALLTKHENEYYDFTLFSPRKFIGVPDGGIVNPIQNNQLDNVELRQPSEDWWMLGFTASVLRREFDRFGGERPWYKLFRETEINSPIGPYRMSELSNRLIRKNFNYQLITNRRRENYKLLLKALENIALFPELPDNVVPLGFPVRIDNRDKVREALYSYQIYPPVHWTMHEIIPSTFKESHALSNNIMTLPCDQRYNRLSIEKIIEAVREVRR